MTDLQVQRQFLDVQTGEMLPATIGNAARVLEAIRDREAWLRDMKTEVVGYLREQSELLGTKTLHDGVTVTVSGGPSVDYDAHKLMEGLQAAGCPQYRISAAVGETVTYKPNKAVLKQLASANPEYAVAIAKAAVHVEGRWRAMVKP